MNVATKVQKKCELHQFIATNTYDDTQFMVFDKVTPARIK